MFSLLKNAFQQLYSSFTSGIKSLYARATIDEQALEELHKLLITADMGAPTTNLLLERVRIACQQGTVHKGNDLKKVLEGALSEVMSPVGDSSKIAHAQLYLLVGVNGSGKTTSAAKLAYLMQQAGKRVLLVAADTFRAGAVEQLERWAQKINVSVVRGEQNQDPASVVFMACKKYQEERFDVLIIDTAGRLQTKMNLMRELEKIKRVIERSLPGCSMATLLTLDATLGQNCLEQARIFNEATPLDGLVLTKMDGTSKGGIVFAIMHELRIPVVYVSCGETVQSLYVFKPHEYIKMLLE